MQKKTWLNKPLLKAALIPLLFSTQALAQDLRVEDPYVRAVPPGAPATAAFMRLHNEGEDKVALIDASSPAARVVELHTHTKVNGVMQMRRVESIEVQAQGMTELKPGGLHLMLIGLHEPLSAGSQIEVNLKLDNGSQIELNLPVRKTTRGGMGAM